MTDTAHLDQGKLHQQCQNYLKTAPEAMLLLVGKVGLFLIIYCGCYRVNAVLSFPDAIFGYTVAVL